MARYQAGSQVYLSPTSSFTTIVQFVFLTMFLPLVPGVNGYNIDTAALAMDYRSVGFREAAAEVARYLVAVEGLELQDPMRLRLLSHLQCYSTQREAAAKASFQTSSWNPMASHSQYNPSAMSSLATHAPPMIGSQHGSQPEPLSSMTSAHAPLGASAYTSEASRMPQHSESSHMAASMAASMRLPGPGNASAQIPSATSSASTASPVFSGLTQVHSQFPGSLGMNSVPMLSPSGHYSTTGLQPPSVKPYRPWGTELAY